MLARRVGVVLISLHAWLPAVAALRTVPLRPLSRRSLLTTLAVGTTAPAAPALAVSAGQSELGTATDLAQVLKSYQTLGRSLDEWASETALMQIGRPTELQRAVDQLPEETLKRLSGESSLKESVAALRKYRQSSLTFLYLASGATKYESQAEGLKRMGEVKEQVAAERAEARCAAAVEPGCPRVPRRAATTHARARTRPQLITLGKLLGIDVVEMSKPPPPPPPSPPEPATAAAS
jgi:hypothetical protein